MAFPTYLGVKESFVARRAHNKAVRLYTTAEVARMVKAHKMVILRWMAKGEVQHPVHYCVQGGISLLWDERDLKSIRSLAAWKRRNGPTRRALHGTTKHN